MSLTEILKYYLYARRGLTHVGLALSFINFVNIFYLASRNWIIPLKYSYLVLICLCLLSPLFIGIGYLDYKRGFFAVESSIGTEQNPYQREHLIPVTILNTYLALKAYTLILEKLEITDSETCELMEKLHGQIISLENKLKGN